MLTNVHEYDDINRLKFHIMLSLIYSLYGYSANSFRQKVSFFCQMFRSKIMNVKNGLKLNAMFTFFVKFLVENRIFSNYLPFN